MRERGLGAGTDVARGRVMRGRWRLGAPLFPTCVPLFFLHVYPSFSYMCTLFFLHVYPSFSYMCTPLFPMCTLFFLYVSYPLFPMCTLHIQLCSLHPDRTRMARLTIAIKNADEQGCVACGDLKHTTWLFRVRPDGLREWLGAGAKQANGTRLLRCHTVTKKLPEWANAQRWAEGGVILAGVGPLVATAPAATNSGGALSGSALGGGGLGGGGLGGGVLGSSALGGGGLGSSALGGGGLGGSALAVVILSPKPGLPIVPVAPAGGGAGARLASPGRRRHREPPASLGLIAGVDSIPRPMGAAPPGAPLCRSMAQRGRVRASSRPTTTRCRASPSPPLARGQSGTSLSTPSPSTKSARLRPISRCSICSSARLPPPLRLPRSGRSARSASRGAAPSASTRAHHLRLRSALRMWPPVPTSPMPTSPVPTSPMPTSPVPISTSTCRRRRRSCRRRSPRSSTSCSAQSTRWRSSGARASRSSSPSSAQ